MVTTSGPYPASALGGYSGEESKLVLCACGFWTYKSLHPHGVRWLGGRLVDCMGRPVSAPEKAAGASTPRPPGETA